MHQHGKFILSTGFNYPIAVEPTRIFVQYYLPKLLSNISPTVSSLYLPLPPRFVGERAERKLTDKGLPFDAAEPASFTELLRELFSKHYQKKGERGRTNGKPH